MTSKEALNTLNKYRNSQYNSVNEEEREIANALNVILPEYVKLADRDTPEKVKIGTSKYFKFPICPNCKIELNEYYKYANKYCKKCGQKLDWSE